MSINLKTLFVTFVTILLIPLSGFAQQPARPAAAPAARPAFRMPPRIVSPEINQDNSVTFKRCPGSYCIG